MRRAQKTQRSRDDEAEGIETFRKRFGDQGVATIGPMEPNLSELSKLAEDLRPRQSLKPLRFVQVVQNMAERVGFDSCVESKATYH